MILFYGCEVINIEEEIPAIINIERFEIEGNHTTNISDAWIYIDNEFQGVFPLPTSFPSLKTGQQKIIVEAGIKKNGIASSREKYPFFTTYTIDQELIPNQSLYLNPTINYIMTSFPYNEDFEGLGTILEVVTDTLNHSLDKVYNSTNSAFGNYYAKSVISGDENEIFECTTNNLNLPKDRSVYLELDYLCNTVLVVGIYANKNNQVNKTAVMYLNAKEQWNKIYISLSEVIANHNDANDYKIFFGMSRDLSSEQNELLLDNIRLVYEE